MEIERGSGDNQLTSVANFVARFQIKNHAPLRMATCNDTPTGEQGRKRKN